MNVLPCFRGRARECLPFVANKVGFIQSQTNPEQWQYIGTRDNPAEMCSRGSKAAHLIDSVLWWRGSQFLPKTELEWQLKNIVNEGGIGRKMEYTLTCLVQPTVSSSSPSWRLNP
ncbi:Hypothetical predicted protein [Paramuricea clavata]|uniref:Uncharacterized protein n=1 Tax=Paramuricea clavata TaxID=317549 RepID=A0A7D9KV80_PARCT|nr:Hypothetical predicted protein [Paramuricea clavata]